MLVIVAAFAVVTLILTAFGSSGGQPTSFPATTVVATGSTPRPEPVATVSNLSIRLPVAQNAVTAIGFHGSTTGGLALKPLGRQINEGLLARLWHTISGSSKQARAWYQLGGGTGPGTAVLDVGAAPDTDVYAPVDGTVASISPTIINGAQHGARIDIRPSSVPSVIVSVSHVQPEPTLAVGSVLNADSSKIGVVDDVAVVERQSLARHTNDSGDNVAIEVHPAPTSQP